MVQGRFKVAVAVVFVSVVGFKHYTHTHITTGPKARGEKGKKEGKAHQIGEETEGMRRRHHLR